MASNNQSQHLVDKATLTAPGNRMLAVTPSDTVDMPNPGTLYVAVAGNVVFIPMGNANGETISLSNLPAGTRLDFVVARRVLVTGTTATVFVVW